MKHGKKYVEGAKLIDRSKLYDTAEALDICVKTGTAKFDETVELHVKLGVDGRHADQQVRGAIVLPNGTGKSVRVLAICKPEKEEEAKAAGADFVGGEEMVQKIQSENWMDFDVLITTPDMMGQVGRLGRLLGPRGLMPNPKAGTVTPDIGKAVTDAKAGKIEYRLDKTNIIHCPIGKASFGVEKLEDRRDCPATEEQRSGIRRLLRAFPAAGELLEDVHDRVTSDLLTQKLARRARGIILRELKPLAAAPGVEHQGFLSAVTYQGSVTLWETVETQAGRVYELWDSYGLAHDLLAPILAAGLATGHQVVACPDPMAPQRLAHLIFPDLSLAFVTSNAAAPWPHHPYRRLRLDAMVDREVYRSSRPRLRFAQKVAQALVDQAVDGLRQAKAAHDNLEALYNPHVDFEGVYQTADQVAGEIFSLPQ